MNFPPHGVILHWLSLDFLGPAQIIEYVTHEANGLVLARYEFFASELHIGMMDGLAS
jgi:hypothetical protein